MTQYLPRMVCCAAAMAIGLGLAAVTAGCTGKGDKGQYTRYPSGVKNRPRVDVSAAQLYVTAADLEPEWGPGQSELNFFDELVTREEVVNDDALHACLLLGTGVSLPTYDERVAVAQRLGWLRRQPARPPLEAATVGEVSRIIVRMMGDKKRVTPARATERLITLGLLPPQIHHYQGLTGAQLVSVLGQVEEALGPADLAAMRRSARENWYAQVPVDDGDNEPTRDPTSDMPVVVEATLPEPVPPAAPVMATPKPEAVSPTPAASPEAPSQWRKGVPLRRPGT